MKSILFYLVILCSVFNGFQSSASIGWKKLPAGARVSANKSGITIPHIYYSVDMAAVRQQLNTTISSTADKQLIDLPMPDGSIRMFRIWSAPILAEVMAAKYPSIRTYNAEAIDNRNITAKIDFTEYGLHVIIFDGVNIALIDQDGAPAEGICRLHLKQDEVRPKGKLLACAQGGTGINSIHQIPDIGHKSAQRISNGTELRTYRLALACDHQYAQTVTGSSNPTIAEVLSKMVTTMNRVNGVYEREFSVTMQMVPNEDTLIWTTENGSKNGYDTFSLVDNLAGRCLPINQAVCDKRIGSDNYDIGHLFTTGAGGYSQIGVVCQYGYKAMSVTGEASPEGDGFDIDYVCHEMGHEFNADHTFNSEDGFCGGGNINLPTAYEPGSGSTIMAYAGICNPDDIQPHTDAYFHAKSLMQIQDFITTLGNSCAVRTPTGNVPVSLPAFSASYPIPYLTPFELTAPQPTNTVSDTSITWCWEEYDLGDGGKSFKNTHLSGPIFRSFNPSRSPTRIFPRDTMVLKGVLSEVGTEARQSEKVPDVARSLNFILSVRDVLNGKGCIMVPDDRIHLDAINTGVGFSVSNFNDSTKTYVGGTGQILNWIVAKTNEAPISCGYVNVYLSIDGGYTWPYYLDSLPNTGSGYIQLPNPDTAITRARLKVKGAGNVFFNVNKYNFKISHSEGTGDDATIYPVPTKSVLNITSGNKGLLNYVIYNSVGQTVGRGLVNGKTAIQVDNMARGVYLIRFFDSANNPIVRKFVLD